MITGLVVSRNNISLDYCTKEAALSLIPYCDEVVISDMESDDGSFEDLEKWSGIDSRIRLVQQKWGNPHNRPTWWVEALNYARTTFVDQNSWLLQLDADEVISDRNETAIALKLAKENGTPGMFKRWNFWQDTKHQVPENRCCGFEVARFGPANIYLPSDEPHPAVEPHIRQTAVHYQGLEIFHYGFLRNPDAFIRKSKVVQTAFLGSVDSRITEMEGTGKKWNERDYFDGIPLRELNVSHPRIARQWLKDRGYEC